MKHKVKTINLEITQADIDNGRKQSCGWCPVAIAVKRQLQLDDVSVGIDNIWLGPDKYTPLPHFIRDWIRNYDASRPVKPFTYKIDVEVQDLLDPKTS